MIDLTEDTQTRPNSPTSTSARHKLKRRPQHTRLVVCPLCQKRFPPAVIQIHAAQCENTDDKDSDSNEDLGCKKTDRFFNQTESRCQMKNYQTTIDQMRDSKTYQQNVVEAIIDSDSSENTFYHQSKRCREDLTGQQDRLDNLYSALEDDTEDASPTLTLKETSPLPQSHGVETQLIPSETGGFIVDMSTVSSSPIKTFTKISDLDALERDRLLNQFKGSTKGRGRQTVARAGQSTAATWAREDFNELVADRGEFILSQLPCKIDFSLFYTLI